MAQRAPRIRHLARILRNERDVAAAVRKALQVVLTTARAALDAAGYDTAVLDSRLPGWTKSLQAEVQPAIAKVFADAWDASSRGVIDPDVYATRHLEAVWNRLVGVADEVHDTMRLALAEGRAAQESIPQLAARVDALLTDEQRWSNRAVTIARTEVIAANNAGALASAGASADVLGIDPGEVVKEWLATSDGRTRESHAEADGQQVLGLNGTFTVGGALLDAPGDPGGPAEEVVNCRCTVVTYFPGDPDYPEQLTSADQAAAFAPRFPAARGVGITPAPASAPVPLAPAAREQVVDAGAQTDQERMARALTIDELQAEARAGSAASRKVARAELRRRGVAASGSRYAGEVEPCTCCGGTGEHLCGHECYVCDAGMSRAAQMESGPGTESLEVGDPIICEGHHGRPTPDSEGRPHEPDAFSPEETPPNTPTVQERPVALPTPTVTVQDDLPQHDADTNITTTDCPCGDLLVFDTANGWQRLDGSYSHDDGTTHSDHIGPPPEDALTAAAPPPDEPTHAGLAVYAADTQRVLMQQRTLDPTDAPDVQGTWEFPSGGIEEGETPQQGAEREFCEETGLPVPDGEVTNGWRNGVYQGFVLTVPSEVDAFGELNPDLAAAEMVNPDDPQRRNPDVTAWFTIEQAQNLGPALRPELAANMDWSVFDAPAAEEETDVDMDTALALVRDAGYTVQLSTLTAAEDDPIVSDPPETEDGPAAASDIAPDGEPFYGIIWPENVQSGDGRGIDAGATTWRDLPLPLMAQDAQAPGHAGAVRAGRIDVIERDETTYAVPVIRYAGVWDTSPIAQETSRQVDNKVVRGISVDGDAVTVELRGSDGAALDPMTDEFPEDGVVNEVATAARVSGGTVCSIPAFHQAYIANGRLEDRADPEPGWNEDGTPKDNTLDAPAPVDGAPVEDPEAMPLVASAGAPARRAPVWSITAAAGILPVVEARYFANPELTEPTPLTVDDDGRVYGHLAEWGTCHIGIDGYCQDPPVSESNYAYFAKGIVATDDGQRVRVGPLTMGTGHADLTLGVRAAAEHYDHTGSVIADVAIGQDAIGIWFSGRVRPTATPDQVYALAAAGAVSGDWREAVRYSGDLELVAALVVNVPGFAMPRPAVAASAAHGLAMVAAGMVRRPAEDTAPATDVHAIAAAVVAHLDRREKAHTVHARLSDRQQARRTARAATAAARLTGRK